MADLPHACAERAARFSALADGELPQDEAGALGAHAAGCPPCAARLAAIGEQRALLRARLAARADALDLSGFGDRVLRAVEADRARPTLAERARVVSLEQWSAHRAAFSAAAGLALAASVLVGVLLRPAPRAGPAAPELLAQASVDLLEIEGQAGAVLEVPGATTVIWVSDEVTR